jgi:hypothetical protein
LSLDHAPFSDVTVTLALATPTDKVKIEPASLVFGPTTTEQWFKISIDSTYTIADLGSTQTVTFALSGTDAAVFKAPSSPFTISIATVPETKPAATITSWAGNDACTQTSCALTPTVTAVGMLWYSVSAKGPAKADGTDNNCPTAATMQEWAVEPNTPDSDMTDN